MEVNDPYAENLNDADLAQFLFEETVESYVPYVGMEFGTNLEAYNFYNIYAEQIGFSVRRGSQAKSKVGISSMIFVCSKQGFGKRQRDEELPIGSSNKPKTPEKEKGMTRVGCQAACRIRLVNEI
jgi:FAR1 DNA-binding domain